MPTPCCAGSAFYQEDVMHSSPAGRPIAVDIETVPTAAALVAPYEPGDHKPPANFKTGASIELWHTGREEKWKRERVKHCSLNPRLGRVLAVGIASEHGGDYTLRAVEHEEPALLRELWLLVGAAGPLVTWGGASFDLPFLAVRSALLGVTPSRALSSYLRRYSYWPHFDTKGALLQWDVPREGETLDAWARFFGLPRKPMLAREVHALAELGELTLVGEYAQHDAETTLAIYDRIAPFYTDPR